MAQLLISSLSVVIPAYNESEVIGQTVQRVKTTVAEKTGIDRLQIVIVSDGSTDDTFDESREALGSTEGVVVELTSNVGSHSAIRCGLQYASGEAIVIMAADGQDPNPGSAHG